MRKNHRRVRAVLTGALVAAGSTAAVTYASITPIERETAAARSYITENKNALPRDLASLSALPYTYRRAVVAKLPFAARREYLLEHLDAFLLPPDHRSAIQQRVNGGLSKALNEEQRRFIRESRDSLSTLLTGEVSDSSVKVFAKARCAASSTLFDADTRSVVFGTIGPRDPEFQRLRSRSARMMKSGLWTMYRPLGRFVASKLGMAQSFWQCTCADTYCDCPGYFCVQRQPEQHPPCDPYNITCGCFQMTQCTGEC